VIDDGAEFNVLVLVQVDCVHCLSSSLGLKAVACLCF
jgi:hypothetical protein